LAGQAVRAVDELDRQLAVVLDSRPQAHVCEVIRLEHTVLSPLGIGNCNVVIAPASVVVVQVEGQPAHEPGCLAGGRGELDPSRARRTGVEELRDELEVAKHRGHQIPRRVRVEHEAVVVGEGHGRFQGKGIVVQREGPDRPKVTQARHEDGGSKTASQ
jgi:hypothetical protein